jgi:predicted DCC family thiol-disulfide oxidoreductase YuxK
MKQKPVLYFDGNCNLCNTWLNILHRFDKKNFIRYVSLQSEIGEKVLRQLQLASEFSDTVIFEKEGVFYFRSEAVLECLKSLGGCWETVNMMRIFPLKLRDGLYNFIARNRYKWFGRTDRCEMV